MGRFSFAALVAFFMLASGPVHAVEATPIHPEQSGSILAQLETYRVAAGRTCKSVSTCREAVELWCSGYRRADRDGDGIPCETVCHSKAEVDRIRAEIGC
ncbi:excalibur calcium-binding domain-containing protein [Aureimonas sp. D3]|uniref:excalibur calcium-binding domain-containing protein n=1 Tax=Aureimonas sp. D3 TaxID=1638164 RepID=UPI000B040070|nr:excalibur calcium-binding domain-containing protein [Aureimonas sp. D3]